MIFTHPRVVSNQYDLTDLSGTQKEMLCRMFMLLFSAPEVYRSLKLTEKHYKSDLTHARNFKSSKAM